MKMIFAAAAFLLFLASAATAQATPPAAKSTSATSALEPKVQKVWENFKAKNKAALGALLAENFREMEEGGNGFGDKKAEIASVDEFELTSCVLKNFVVKSLGPHSALVTYSAHYEGKTGGQMQKSDSIFGEVWVQEGKSNDWKVLYIQETTVK